MQIELPESMLNHISFTGKTNEIVVGKPKPGPNVMPDIVYRHPIPQVNYMPPSIK